MRCTVFFVDERTASSFHKLKKSRSEDRRLLKWIEGALEDIERDCTNGIQIPKRLVPKKYCSLDSLYKYDLPGGWRLLYTVITAEDSVQAIVLEWLPHRKYERLFGY